MSRGFRVMRGLAFARSAVLLLGVLALSACGGGGGGGGSSSGNGVSINTSAISLTADANGPVPTQQSYEISWSNSKIAGVVVGVPPSETVPSWVDISLVGSSSPLLLHIGVNTTSMPAGTYTMTLRIVSGDSNSNVINYVDVPVTYTIKNVIGATPNQLSYNYVLGDATLPASQSLALSGTNINWTANADQGWVKLGSASGTSPTSLPITVDPTGMAAGSYQATVTITNTSAPSNVLQIPVSLTIDKPKLSLSTSAVNFSYVYGSSAIPAGMIVTLSGYQINWTATSSKSWALLNANTGTGNTDLTVSVDPTGLSPGTHTATLTFTDNDDSTNVVTLNVTASVSLPTVSMSTASISLGGSDGKTQTPVSANFSLNTGTNSYPWTMTFDTGSSGNWLQSDVSSGNVAESPVQAFQLSADTSILSGGVYSATAKLSINVNGQLINQSIPVTLKYEPRRIYVGANGEAFVSTPSITRLSDSISVLDSYGTTAVAWDASSDQSWLTVTASGKTGDQLTLTADPTGLSTDVIHYANVTINSSDSSIVNSETVRVGFWVGTADPAATDSLAENYSQIVADPIRPYVYANNGGTGIDIYNVYTDAYVTTIAGVGTQLGNMTVSRNGSTLYAVDLSNDKIVPVNLDTQTVGTPWTTSATSAFNIAATRVESHDIIVTSLGLAYDAVTGSAYSSTFSLGTAISTSLNGNEACGVDVGLSPYTVSCVGFGYAQINGGLVTSGAVNKAGLGSDGEDVALSNDGSQVFVAAGSPYTLETYSTDTLTHGMTLSTGAYPNNAEVAVDGNILAASQSVLSTSPDTWVFNSVGTLLNSHHLAGSAHSIRARQLVVSGDGKRIIVSTDDPTLQFVTAP